MGIYSLTFCFAIAYSRFLSYEFFSTAYCFYSFCRSLPHFGDVFFVGWLRLKQSIDNGQQTTGKDLPFVSIVIPTRNESENIKACLESIFKQNYPKDLFEVVMVDDYSTDPTLRFAREIEGENLTVLNLMQYLGNPGEYVPNKKKQLHSALKTPKAI